MAVFFSLLVARLITPMMAAYWLQPPKAEETSSLTPLYERLLQWSLRHRMVTVVAGVGFFVLSIVLFSHMPTDLFTREDRGRQRSPGQSCPRMASLADTGAVTQAAWWRHCRSSLRSTVRLRR